MKDISTKLSKLSKNRDILASIDRTIVAIEELQAKRQEQERQEFANSDYSFEELKVLSHMFDCQKKNFVPFDDKKLALTKDEVQILVAQGNYGCLKDFTSECAQVLMTDKQFLTAALAAICDNESYFTFNKELNILSCNVVGCEKQVPLEANKDLFHQVAQNIKSTKDRDIEEVFKAFAVVHAYLFYLAMFDKLECEEEVRSLFMKKDTYKTFFDEVIRSLSHIFILGLNNINYDICEKVKALYIQSASYHIEFLRSALYNLYQKLIIVLDDRSKTNLSGIFDTMCRIINTVESMRYQDDRKKLINLYGLNEGHEYVINKAYVIGCGYCCYDFSNSYDTNKSYRFYFYDFISRRFLVVKTIVTDYFASSNNLFDSGISLKQLCLRHLSLHDIFVIDNKLTNSHHSYVHDHFLQDTIVSADNKKVATNKFDDNTYTQELEKLYGLFAFNNFDSLKEAVYSKGGQYFINNNQTQGMYLVKVSKILKVNNSNIETSSVLIADKDGNELSVLLQRINSAAQKLLDYKNINFTNFYMLLQCPIIAGLMRPNMVTMFGHRKKNSKSKK